MTEKRVVAPLREIQEVKNAIAAYDLFSELDPFSVPDLLKAHNVMMTALIEEPGKFRKGGVGVSDGKQVVHIAPPTALVPGQIKDLFHWLKMDLFLYLLAAAGFGILSLCFFVSALWGSYKYGSWRGLLLCLGCGALSSASLLLLMLCTWISIFFQKSLI